MSEFLIENSVTRRAGFPLSNGKKMTPSQSRRKKKNRRRLARATARYFRELDESAVKDEKLLAARFRLTKRISQEIDRS
jgi:hypothetical protein